MTANMSFPISCPANSAPYSAEPFMEMIFRLLRHKDCKGKISLLAVLRNGHIMPTDSSLSQTNDFHLYVTFEGMFWHVTAEKRASGPSFTPTVPPITKTLFEFNSASLEEAREDLTAYWPSGLPAEGFHVPYLVYSAPFHSVGTFGEERTGPAPGLFGRLIGKQRVDADFTAWVQQTVRNGLDFAAFDGTAFRYDFGFFPQGVTRPVFVKLWRQAADDFLLEIDDRLEPPALRKAIKNKRVTRDGAAVALGVYMDKVYGYRCNQWMTLFRAVYTDI